MGAIAPQSESPLFEHRLPWGALDLCFVFAMAEIGAVALTMLAASWLGPGQPAFLVAAYWIAPALLLGVTLAVLTMRGEVKNLLHAFGRPTAGHLLGFGLAAGCLLQLVGDVATGLISQVWHVTSNNPLITEPHLRRAPLLLGLVALAVVVLAPLAEEIFFRGLLFSWLFSRYGFWPAAVLSGACFGLAHFSLSLLIPLWCVGMVLAWLFYRTRSLLVSIVAHGALNLVALAGALVLR